MIGRGPKSCLLGHVAGLLFCLYAKLFLPSFLNPLDSWSSMSCIALDIELAYKNVIKELDVFIDGNVQGHSFRPPKKYKPTNQAIVLVNKNFARNCVKQWMFGLQWACKHSSYSCEGWKLCKRDRKMQDSWQDSWRDVEKLEDHGCPNFQDRVDPKQMNRCGVVRVTHSETRPHFTEQSASQNCLVTGQSSIRSCKFCMVKCIISIYENKSQSESINFPIFINEKLSLQGRLLIKNIILI